MQKVLYDIAVHGVCRSPSLHCALHSAGDATLRRTRSLCIACHSAAPGQVIHMMHTGAGEAPPRGMTVYSNDAHDLSASSSGRGSSSAGPLEMSLPGLRPGKPNQDSCSCCVSQGQTLRSTI